MNKWITVILVALLFMNCNTNAETKSVMGGLDVIPNNALKKEDTTIDDFQGKWKATDIIFEGKETPIEEYEGMYLAIEIKGTTVYTTNEETSSERVPITFKYDGGILSTKDDSTEIQIYYDSREDRLILTVMADDTYSYKLARDYENNKILAENNEGWVIWDSDDVKLTITKNFKLENTYNGIGLSIEIIIENNTDHQVEIDIKDSAVNGWQVSNDNMYVNPTNPGRKNKRRRQIYLNDADINNINDIRTIELSFRVYNYDTHETMFETDIIPFSLNI